MKKFLFTIISLLATTSGVFAANTFIVDDVYILNASESEANIIVKFNFEDGFSGAGYDFHITLPSGIVPVFDDDPTDPSPVYTLGDCYKNPPTVITNLVGSDLTVNVAGGDAFNKQSGTLITLKVKSTSALEKGTSLNVSLNSAHFVNYTTSFSEDAADVDFNIVVTDRVILDEESESLPVAQSGVNVLVKRTLKKDVWNTICLPFAMTEAQLKSAFGDDVELAYLNTENAYSVNENAITINFNLWEVSWGLLANYPLLIKTSATIEDFTVDNVDVVADESAAETSVQWVKSEKSSTPPFPTIQVLYAKYIGTLKAGTSIPADNLFLSGNRFYYSTGTTTIKGFRGYFYFKDFNSSAFAPEFVINGETTNIEGLQIVDGDGRIYNLNGQHVENPTKKGVYIQNGKKVVMKK